MATATYRKQYRETHKSLGLCTECNTEAVDGKIKCVYHLTYAKTQHLKKRNSRKEQNLCTDCIEKALPNNCRCEFHRVHHLKRLKRTRTALRKVWKLSNRCTNCGVSLNPEMDGNSVKCLNCRLIATLPFKRTDFKF